jgi:hypothetical protein
VLHPNPKNQLRIPLAGQHRHWASDGVLKPLLESRRGIYLAAYDGFFRQVSLRKNEMAVFGFREICILKLYR